MDSDDGHSSSTEAVFDGDSNENEGLSSAGAEESQKSVAEQQPVATEEVNEAGDESSLGIKFPLSRIKKIMKADPELQLANQAAVFLIAKATELFVEVVADSAYHHTVKANRKTVSGRDVEACIELIDALAFLDGALNDYVSQSGPYRPPGGVEEMQGRGRRVRLEWGAYITV
ncbi:Transcription factor CBF/NF-Y/archaeal histone domain [Trinorchestia longiramus]|nr:Transcription factor CBF/NF-Y/archaeal histone domain [Trinorchestia longiramus]